MAGQVDVVVLGMGVGGEAVAGRLAEAGLSVTGIENRLVGGECPYWGCVPTKMMIRAANLVAEARRVDGMAGQAEVTPDWQPVAARIRDEATADWNDQAAVDRFTAVGGRFIRGRGRLAGPGLVEVDGETIEARRGVVVATGTEPVIPPIEGLAGTPFWTNRDAVETKSLPRSLIVLGGGAIGAELAQVFARFGVDVTIVEASDRLLHLDEPEASALASEALAADSITVRTGTRAMAVRHDGTGFTVTVGDETALSAEQLLVAVGRRADLTGLGLDAVGLDPEARAVKVDEHMRAGDRLWAVGDVTGHGVFTHLATYQAAIAARDILGEAGPPADYRALPRVTFTDPEIGVVGLTEADARAAGIQTEVGQAELPDTARGWIHKAGNAGLIKLVADTEHGVLVGATAVGPTGGEVIAALAVAVHARVPLGALRHMIYAYPTFHRGIEQAVHDIG
jgi:pyruvate/2-oxoglutarate dehydrogenase complex dihydrolipoamide dehydrogenase (E3) component